LRATLEVGVGFGLDRFRFGEREESLSDSSSEEDREEEENEEVGELVGETTVWGERRTSAKEGK